MNNEFKEHLEKALSGDFPSAVIVGTVEDGNQLRISKHFDAFPNNDIPALFEDRSPSPEREDDRPAPTAWRCPPRKVLIVTHLRTAPESLSIARAVRRQSEMLAAAGHDVTVACQEGANFDWGCRMAKVIPHFKREKNVVNEEAKEKMRLAMIPLLLSHDVVLTHDLYLQDAKTYREGYIDACKSKELLGRVIPTSFHFARSRLGEPVDFRHHSFRYVYMNRSEMPEFAASLGVSESLVDYCPNERELAEHFDWSAESRFVADHTGLLDAEVRMVAGMCSTRLLDKGIGGIIRTLAAVKKKGKRVCLVIANSNASSEDVKQKLVEWRNYARNEGLTGREFWFTSEIGDQWRKCFPNRAVRELMNAANLFVFPTTSEVCPNSLLEAMASRNLLVLNEDLPLLRDFTADGSCLLHPYGSHLTRGFRGIDCARLDSLAGRIIERLDSDWGNRNMQMVISNHSERSNYAKYLSRIVGRGLPEEGSAGGDAGVALRGRSSGDRPGDAEVVREGSAGGGQR
jgi:glycosyltransferase involved in cell wall biosynthesis